MTTTSTLSTETRVPPPRRKLALLTWAGAWAVITLILWALGPVMDTWPLPVRTLLISALMVVTLTWVVIPKLTRVFAGWLARPLPSRPAAAARTTPWRISTTWISSSAR